MKRLWLVRHGPTHAREMIGWTDRAADLSDLGALSRLGALLPHDVPVISSDLIRAVATADALQGTRPRLPHDPRLREIHFGAWDGLTHAEADARDAALLRAFWEDAGDVAAPEGESWNAMAARVHAGLDALPDQAIVVCHFGPILAALQRARGCSVQVIFGQKIDPLSLSEVHFDGSWQIGRVNHIS